MSWKEKPNPLTGKAINHQKAAINSKKNSISKSTIKPPLEYEVKRLYNLYVKNNPDRAYYIPDNFVLFNKYTNTYISSCFNHRCYKNSLEIVKSNPEKYNLALGVTFQKNQIKELLEFQNPQLIGERYIIPYPHGWLVNNKNEIVDFTFGYDAKDYIYFGFIVDDLKLKKLNNEEEVEKYLLKIFHKGD